MQPLLLVVLCLLYAVTAAGLLVYGLNCFVMLALFRRRRHAAQRARAELAHKAGAKGFARELPAVTTQIAVFNEVNVVDRIVRAVAAMEYPAGRHEIQVLDDSDDETRESIDRVAAELNRAGHDVKVVRRPTRQGFKAGALAEGLGRARGEFVAVFDADFVPPRDFLMATVPFFLDNPRLGLVQTRWGHLNRRRSLLTRAQSVGIDGHFVVEQVARCWNNLFMNFNGTGGVWRREAIEQAGGWQWDTLTEDLDLSYRVQFAGWGTLYLPDVVVPAELPEDVSAFRGQQFRWAKGSLQTLIKLLPRLLEAPVPWFKKVQAVIHMGNYIVYPLMLLLALLALPVLVMREALGNAQALYAALALPLSFAVVSSSALYFVSQLVTYRDWMRRVVLLPLLIIVGVGLALSNTRAIFEAVTGRQTPFVRTPKRGDQELKAYRVKLPWLAFLEIGLGLYSVCSFGLYMAAGRYLLGSFLAVYASGFLFIGLLTLLQSLEPPFRAAMAAGKERIGLSGAGPAGRASG